MFFLCGVLSAWKIKISPMGQDQGCRMSVVKFLTEIFIRQLLQLLKSEQVHCHDGTRCPCATFPAFFFITATLNFLKIPS